MNFEYLKTVRNEASIDIEDIGKVFLDAYNDNGQEYCFSITTSLGFSKIKVFGPFENGKQMPFFSYYTNEMEFNEQRIVKTIKDFLNGKKDLTQVFEITEEEFNNKISLISL